MRSWPAATRPKGDEVAGQREVRAWCKKHPYASAVELGEFRAGLQARQSPRCVPHFDLTISAVKSVSVLHASYRVAAHVRSRGTAGMSQLGSRPAPPEPRIAGRFSVTGSNRRMPLAGDGHGDESFALA